MKYDDNLVYEILLRLEQSSTPGSGDEIEIDGYSREEISYHIKKMHEQVLVEGKDVSSFGNLHWIAVDLTSMGHKKLSDMKKEREENVSSSASKQPSATANPRKVFVVHGRNEVARKAMFQFLGSIGLTPLEWSEAVKATGKASPYVGEVLDTAFSMAQAVVVLMTPDDEGQLRLDFRGEDEDTYETELTPQARLNVLFEAGMAMGRDPKRTVLVELGRLRPFSDIGGRHVIKMNGTTQRRQDLAEKTRDC